MKNALINSKGFTLIELLTTVAVMGISFLGIYVIFMKSTDIYSEVLGRSLAVQTIEQATDVLTRETKNLRDKNSILIASASQFRFTNNNGQNIDLTYTDQQLKKNAVAFASHVTAFSLTYKKWDGTSWTSGATNLIASVHYSITVRNSGKNVTFQNSILLRNAR
ncbi:prepilin-type N-terminal cleavage/methylation domain-containing protein [bacterium]|nr:prepilin-type N-terminal cleavage/methylation domain-containing protein [bacterium]